MFAVLLLFVVGIANADQNHDINVVARTLLAEAKGDGSNGMSAVACVIQQRVIERHLTAAEVCLQSKQFSCWNKATESDRQTKVLKNDWQSSCAQKLATAIVKGEALDRSAVGFANSYCGTDCYPSWSWKAKRVATVGGHKFFRV